MYHNAYFNPKELFRLQSLAALLAVIVNGLLCSVVRSLRQFNVHRPIKLYSSNTPSFKVVVASLTFLFGIPAFSGCGGGSGPPQATPQACQNYLNVPKANDWYFCCCNQWKEIINFPQCMSWSGQPGGAQLGVPKYSCDPVRDGLESGPDMSMPRPDLLQVLGCGEAMLQTVQACMAIDPNDQNAPKAVELKALQIQWIRNQVIKTKNGLPLYDALTSRIAVECPGFVIKVLDNKGFSVTLGPDGSNGCVKDIINGSNQLVLDPKTLAAWHACMDDGDIIGFASPGDPDQLCGPAPSTSSLTGGTTDPGTQCIDLKGPITVCLGDVCSYMPNGLFGAITTGTDGPDAGVPTTGTTTP